MNKLISTLLCVLFPLNVLSATCDIPTKIKQGDESPCNGYVISDTTELKIRTDLIYKQSLIENLTKTNEIYREINLINDEQLRIYREQLNSEKTLSTWEKALYFGFGALVTGAVAYGTVRLIQ